MYRGIWAGVAHMSASTLNQSLSLSARWAIVSVFSDLSPFLNLKHDRQAAIGDVNVLMLRKVFRSLA